VTTVSSDDRSSAEPDDADRAGPRRPPLAVRGAGRYEVLLILLTLVLILAPFVSTVLQPVIVALLGGALVYALWTSLATVAWVWFAAGMSVACVATSAVAPIWTPSPAAYALVSIVLCVAAITSITVHLTRRRTATSATLAGAVAIYLLAGLAFANLYLCLAEVSGVPFFAQTTSANSVAYLYYSYTILTTVGFGDLTARTDPGRMLAVVEALVGQLYLVTVVAVIVATRRPRRSS
jgi:hypothetical protein